MKKQTLLKSTLCLLMALVCNVAWAAVTLPKVSTGSEMHYYRIKSLRTGKYAAYTGDDLQLAQTSEQDGLTFSNIWYVTADGENYKLHNVSTDFMYAGVSSFTSTGATTHIKENPYRAGYVCVSITADLTSNCWDDQGSGTKIGNYAPSQNDNEGTSWTFEEITEGISYHTCSFTLNEPTIGESYTGSYTCVTYNNEKSLPSCVTKMGATLTNIAWGENTLTADIKFPFPVSKEGNARPVVISGFKGSLEAGSSKYYVDGTNVKARPSGTVAKGYDEWEIYPTFANGEFTFVIKNVATGKYIKSNATTAVETDGTITVVDKADATSFALVQGNRFKLPGTSLYLSIGSSNGTKNLGLWGYYSNNGGVHYGVSNFVYLSQLPCVLTDADGNQYTGTLDGTASTLPSFPRLTVSNKAFNEDGTNFTATVTFPFPVSSEEQVNATFIANWGASGDPKKWCPVLEDGVYNVKVYNTANSSSIALSEVNKWRWAIYPQFANGTFTYLIKNVHTGTYVYADPDRGANAGSDKGRITLQEEGTAFTVVENSGNTNFAYVNKAGTTLKLTTNGSGDNNVYLGSYADGHAGNHIAFSTPKYIVTTDANGYAAIYTPMAVTIPSGVTVYTGWLNSAKTTLVLNQVNTTIPAGAAVILKGEASTNYTFTVADNVAAITNDLKGSKTEVAATTDTYTFNASDATFTKTEGNVNAYAAYLEVSGAADIISTFVSEDITTLDEVENYVFQVHGQRGFIYVNNQNLPAALNNADGNTGNDVAYDVANDKHHFAVVNYKGSNYLYNIGAQKFLIRNGDNGVALADRPVHAVTFENSNNATYAWIIKLGGAMINISNGGGHTNSIRIAGESNPDEGARWALCKTGTFDNTEVLNRLKNITEVSQLSNTSTYKVYGKRGFIYATEGETPVLKGTNVANVTYNAENPYHHFAIIEEGGNYYLYNVGAKKFVIKNANNTSLSDNPARQTFTLGNATDLSTAHDLTISLDGTWMHLSQAGNNGVYVNNGTQDEGTRWSISEVTTDFNPEDVLNIIRNYNRQLPIRAEVEGSWENNPNTHFGSVRATSASGTITTKLKKGEGVVMLDYNGLEETNIDFTRAYRGFEFQGFKLGDKDLGKSFEISEELKNSITEQNPLVAKFTATEAVTLFYDDDEFSYRIPAIAKTSTGRLIAVSDYRHNLDDIGRDKHGTGERRIDLVMRTSSDNGKTWSVKRPIIEGSGTPGSDCAYGDAAIAVVGEKVLVMAAAGDVFFTNGNASTHNRTVRLFSEDGGDTWEDPVDISETLFIGSDATIQNGYCAFFGSGKLAVDEDFNGSGKARIYGAMLVKKSNSNYNNYVIFTDDLGLTWKILGGSQERIAAQDEPKVEILPNGQILLSVRRQGGRQFRVFTYGNGETDRANGVGSWGDAAVDGCDNGGENGTNGDTYCIDAKKADGTPVKILLQSQPQGGTGQWDRNDVTFYYKEISSEQSAIHTPTSIASGWIKGLQVSNQQSSYSAMTLQADGKIAFFFEEAPCYDDNYEKGYSMVYIPLTIEEITKNKYFSPAAVLPENITVNMVLTDAQGNEYHQTMENTTLANIGESVPSYVTLGENDSYVPNQDGSYTYTNTVTLPFKVSNENTTVWHNIYFPANGRTECYPVYLMDDGANNVKTSTKETGNHGAQSMNTYSNADKISWAIYQAGDGFNFIFKNKLNGRYIKVNGDPVSGRSNNTQYTTDPNEAVAFGIVDGRNNSFVGEYGISFDGGQLTVYSVDDQYVSYSTDTAHQGGWVKIVEAPDFETLITEVNATLGMIGTSLGQYTASEANAAAAAAAKEAMQNSGSVKLNTLNSYKNLLNGATLNMPVAGQFFRICGISGNYIDATSIYNNANATTGQMSMKSADACNYNGTIFYFDEDKHLLNYSTGTYTRQTSYIGAVGDADKAVWTISESPRKGGKYALRNTVTSGQIGQQLHDSDGNRADRCGNNCGVRHDFTLEEVTELPFTFKKAALGFATFNAPVPVELPEGVLAYVAAVDENKTTLHMYRLEGNVIPANTPVMLYNEAAKATEAEESTPIGLKIVDVYTGGEADAIKTKNDFYGTVAAETYPASTTGETVYSLQKKQKVQDTDPDMVGFYKKADNTTLGGFKAWVKTATASARAFTIIFDGDDATGLKEALGLENENVEIYDLSGRRLDKPAKGVNVIGGKLVIK